MSFRLAACAVAAALLLWGCAKNTTATTAKTTGTKVAAPLNAPVPRAGEPGAIPLSPDQRREVDATAAKAPPSIRPRLRYALAAGDDGKTHLVVYDGAGLGVSGRPAGKQHAYVLFQVLNSADGEHYDPQQNSVVAPIPPPPQRDVVPAKP